MSHTHIQIRLSLAEVELIDQVLGSVTRVPLPSKCELSEMFGDGLPPEAFTQMERDFDKATADIKAKKQLAIILLGRIAEAQSNHAEFGVEAPDQR